MVFTLLCPHLQEISEHKGIPSFWVDSAARIDVATNTILHKLSHGELVETKDWLKKDGPLVLGITSGASTPDRAVEEVLERIFKIKVGWVHVCPRRAKGCAHAVGWMLAPAGLPSFRLIF